MWKSNGVKLSPRPGTPGRGAGVRGVAGHVDCDDEMQEQRRDVRKWISSQTRFLPTDNRTLAKADEPPRQARWGWTRSAQTPLSLPQWIRAFALRDFL